MAQIIHGTDAILQALSLGGKPQGTTSQVLPLLEGLANQQLMLQRASNQIKALVSPMAQQAFSVADVLGRN